jgi:hypothetical protein
MSEFEIADAPQHPMVLQGKEKIKSIHLPAG